MKVGECIIASSEQLGVWEILWLILKLIREEGSCSSGSYRKDQRNNEFLFILYWHPSPAPPPSHPPNRVSRISFWKFYFTAAPPPPTRIRIQHDLQDNMVVINRAEGGLLMRRFAGALFMVRLRSPSWPEAHKLVHVDPAT